MGKRIIVVATVPLASLLFVLALASCSVLRGSGHVTTQTRLVRDFRQVSISGGGTLTIAQTGVESLTVQAEDSILPAITTEVHGDRLEIGEHGDTTFVTTLPIHYTLTVKHLSALEVSGSSDVQATGLRELTSLMVSGSGSITAAGISVATTLHVSVSGSAHVTLAGMAGEQDVTLDGSAAYDARSLPSGAATLRVSGSTDAAIQVRDMLEGEASGSSSVVYFGSPRVSMRTEGSATVRQG